MKKLPKIYENFENMVKTINMAKEALRNGLGPAHNSNKTFVAIPGIINNKAIPGIINNKAYYAIIVEKDENGSKPVDWYSWSPDPKFVSGFGGWHNDDYDTFVKENPWVKDVWDSLDIDIKAVFEKKI